MDGGKTLEERLYGRYSVVSGCAVLLLCICCTCCTCGVVYLWCCVHVVYVGLCTNGVVYMLHMWCYVHMVLCIYGVGNMLYMWCYVHVVQVVMCTCCAGGVVYM